MTSACTFKDILRNDTQVFLNSKSSIFEICLHPINFNFTPDFLTSSMLSRNAGTSRDIPTDENQLSLPAIPNHFSKSILIIQLQFLNQ